MLPTIEVIYFIQKSPLVQSKIENVNCPELPCLKVSSSQFYSANQKGIFLYLSSDWLKFKKREERSSI
jgi:hypothetical protein